MEGGEWGLSLGIKLPGRETDHSPPSGAKAKNKRSDASIHPYVFIALRETGEEPVVEYKIMTITAFG